MNQVEIKPQQVAQQYRSDIELLVRYLPWLEAKYGKVVSHEYKDDKMAGSTFSFPVYDGTLMNLVKDIRSTKLTDRNYYYVYSRNHIQSVKDEYELIERASIQDINVLIGILSKYVLGGMTKGNLWAEAVANGVFLKIITKLKELLEFWDKPLE